MNKFQHLLSPVVIGGVVLKNRLMGSKSLPHFLQGPEPFPTNEVISYLANYARNGAAVVTVKGHEVYDDVSRLKYDMAQMPRYDLSDTRVGNYFSKLADAIHFYGAKASISLHMMEPKGMNISQVTEETSRGMQGDYRIPLGREMTRQDMEDMIGQFVGICRTYQALGFDMCNLYMTYRSSILACCLSPAVNKRTDAYGGSVENRCRFPLELCRAIKAACGQDFLIEAQISGEEEAGGYTLEDTVAFAKLAEGAIDILTIRGFDGSESHPTGLNSRPGQYATLRAAEAIKKSGARVLVAVNGGYQDPLDCERILAEGKADLFSMARTFICDHDYYQKLLDGREEDIVPCVRCNKCHVTSRTGPWVSLCTVNPMQGYQFKHLFKPTGQQRRIAVVGGGPAGMAAARYGRLAGHQVTLFEAGSALGGQLFHTAYPSFKWPLERYKRFLTAQMDRLGVDVRLNTRATPELLSGGSYDVIIAATGARPVRPPIPGADQPGVWLALDVYGRERELGRRVIVVGGSETGTETGMYLAENGHEVVVLSRREKLASDATPVHYYDILREAWERLELFSFLTEAHTTGVSPTSVTYTDRQGRSHTLEADSVVVCGGMVPLREEALAFQPLCSRFYLIGDARQPKNVQQCTRQAFGVITEL